MAPQPRDSQICKFSKNLARNVAASSVSGSFALLGSPQTVPYTNQNMNRSVISSPFLLLSTQLLADYLSYTGLYLAPLDMSSRCISYHTHTLILRAGVVLIA